MTDETARERERRIFRSTRQARAGLDVSPPRAVGGSPSNSDSPAGRGGIKTCKFYDQDALSANIEAIASGKITVVE